MTQFSQNILTQNSGLVSNNNLISNTVLTSTQNNQQPLVLPVQQTIPQPMPVQQNQQQPQPQPQFYQPQPQSQPLPQPQPQIVQNNQSPQISVTVSSPISNSQKDSNCRFFD